MGGVGEPPIEGLGDHNDQDQKLVSSAVEKWMKRMVQSVTSDVKTERQTPQAGCRATFSKPRLPPKPQTVPKPSKILRLLQDPSPSPPPQETGARLKTTQKKKKSWTSAALEGSLEGIKSSLTPRAVKCLKAPPGWEDWEQGKKLRRGLAGSDY